MYRLYRSRTWQFLSPHPFNEAGPLFSVPERRAAKPEAIWDHRPTHETGESMPIENLSSSQLIRQKNHLEGASRRVENFKEDDALALEPSYDTDHTATVEYFQTQVQELEDLMESLFDRADLIIEITEDLYPSERILSADCLAQALEIFGPPAIPLALTRKNPVTPWESGPDKSPHEDCDLGRILSDTTGWTLLDKLATDVRIQDISTDAIFVRWFSLLKQ